MDSGLLFRFLLQALLLAGAGSLLLHIVPTRFRARFSVGPALVAPLLLIAYDIMGSSTISWSRELLVAGASFYFCGLAPAALGAAIGTGIGRALHWLLNKIS